MSIPIYIQTLEGCTIIEFQVASLTDAAQIQEISRALTDLVELENRRRIIMDMDGVKFISSQMIGVFTSMHKMLSKVAQGGVVLCNVGPNVAELLRITRLDKLLAIFPTQAEALRAFRDS